MSESVILNVTGMKCGGCESNLTSKLKALTGVITVKAKHKDKHVTVEFDSTQTSLQAIEQVISAAGFEVS